MRPLPDRGNDGLDPTLPPDEMPVRPTVGSVPVDPVQIGELEEDIRKVSSFSALDHRTASPDHDPAIAANRELERGAAAESAVRVVMDQVGLVHPTRISVWTMREIARLLDALHAGPEGEIKLGGQTLGAGFAFRPPVKIFVDRAGPGGGSGGPVGATGSSGGGSMFIGPDGRALTLAEYEKLYPR